MLEVHACILCVRVRVGITTHIHIHPHIDASFRDAQNDPGKTYGT